MSEALIYVIGFIFFVAIIIMIIALIISVIATISTIAAIIGSLFGGGTAISNYYKSFRSNVALR